MVACSLPALEAEVGVVEAAPLALEVEGVVVAVAVAEGQAAASSSQEAGSQAVAVVDYT